MDRTFPEKDYYTLRLSPLPPRVTVSDYKAKQSYCSTRINNRKACFYRQKDFLERGVQIMLLNSSTGEQAESADGRLFTMNTNPVVRSRLPEKSSKAYSLRPRAHMGIPYLRKMIKTFVPLFLFKNIYLLFC